MITPAIIINIIIAVIIAVIRLFGVTNNFYQAIAHLFLGGLVGAWLIGRKSEELNSEVISYYYLAIAIILTIVEIGAFIWFNLRN